MALTAHGFARPDAALDILRRSVVGSEYGGVTPDARAAFAALVPPLLEACGRHERSRRRLARHQRPGRRGPVPRGAVPDTAGERAAAGPPLPPGRRQPLPVADAAPAHGVPGPARGRGGDGSAPSPLATRAEVRRSPRLAAAPAGTAAHRGAGHLGTGGHGAGHGGSHAGRRVGAGSRAGPGGTRTGWTAGSPSSAWASWAGGNWAMPPTWTCCLSPTPGNWPGRRAWPSASADSG